MRLYRRGRTWWCAYYDVDGRRIRESTRCSDRKAAEAFAQEREREAANPDHATADKAALSAALADLIEKREEEARAGKRSEATARFYRVKAGHLVRVFERDASGNEVPFRLLRLRARDVDRYISVRRKEGAAENTIAKELVTLRAALKLALRSGLWTGNLDAVMPAGFAPEYKPRNRFLTREEIGRLVGQLTTDRAARVAFIVATSACLGETDRARRDHIAKDLSSVFLDGTKRTQRRRTVPIVTKDQKKLLAYALKHAEGKNGLLFRPWGKVCRDLELACTKIGIERCSPNDLRRTCATWLRAAGAPVELVAPVMGHVDSRMVERVYGKLPTDELRARLYAALGPDHCDTFVPDTVDSGGLDGLRGRKRSSKVATQSKKSMGPEGVEPSTLGLKNLILILPTPHERERKRLRHYEAAAQLQQNFEELTVTRPRRPIRRGEA
jgi:integrase